MAVRKKSVQKEEKKIITTVESDAVDNLMFEMVKEAPGIAALCEDADSEGCVNDAFKAFYTHDPKTKEKADHAQKSVVDTFMALDEFKNLREGTQYDDVASALSAMDFAPEMLQQVRAIRKKLKERQEQQNGDGNQDGQGQGQSGEEEGEGEGQGNQPSLKELLGEDGMSKLRQSMRRALENGQKKADDWHDAAKAWGLDSGELAKVPFERRMELADKICKSSKLKKISDLLGRFKNIVHSAAAKVPCHGVDEIVNITVGNDVGRLLPSELIKLVESPELFYVDFLEKKLLNYEMKSVDDMGRGPIIACLDISSSMTDQGKEEWAKAVVLALMTLAEKQRRSFGFIAFNSKVEVAKFFKKGQPISFDDKAAIAEVISDGGTDFYPALMKAFEFRIHEPSLKPADIVFITDGECEFRGRQLEEVLAAKAKADIRIQSIAISAGGWGPMSNRTLAQFSDQVNVVDNLGEISSVKELMKSTAQSQFQSGVKPPQKDAL